jgi:RNA polymerase sigma-70 factor, ECF subfamily
MNDEPPDLELLMAWRAGDETAGAALYQRYANGIIRFFMGRVRCETTAQDLTSRTFLACVEGRDRIRKETSFRSYVFGVAHNLFREHLRKAARAPVDASVTSAADLGPTASAMIAGAQQERALLEALRRIPLEHQIVYELHLWEGLSGSEIALVIGAPEGTVRTRLRKGKWLLARELARIATSTNVLRSTITSFDVWASKLREMLGRRSAPRPPEPPCP